jgi:hypothetical protein
MAAEKPLSEWDFGIEASVPAQSSLHRGAYCLLVVADTDRLGILSRFYYSHTVVIAVDFIPSAVGISPELRQ